MLIDNGSSLIVMPKVTLEKLSRAKFPMKPSTMIVRAFDGNKREVMGEVELPVQVGLWCISNNFSSNEHLTGIQLFTW